MSDTDMTSAEQILSDDKARAEIANLNALTAKLAAETYKLNAEGAKLSTENRWYPAVVGAGFMAAAVTIAKLFF